VDEFGTVRGMARHMSRKRPFGGDMTGILGYARVSTGDQDVAG
jgi:hypothetical protein